MRNDEKPEASNMHPSEAWWDGLWKLHIPPKIKLLLWKLSHSWLPTKSVLFKLGICNVDCCFRCCGKFREDIHHAPWFCLKSKKL